MIWSAVCLAKERMEGREGRDGAVSENALSKCSELKTDLGTLFTRWQLVDGLRPPKKRRGE